jgi:hypothetical protein
MLDRIAIATSALRLIGVALLMFLIARVRVDVPASVFMMTPPAQTKLAASAIRCPHGSLSTRTRSPGLHERYFVRDLSARRHLVELGR